MKFSLNIYKNSREIEKTYTANDFELMTGTVEDLIAIIDVDSLTGGEVSDTEFVAAALKVVTKGWAQVKDLIMEIFPEVTEEEMKRTKIKELAFVLVEVLKYGFSQIMGASSSKN